MTGLRPTLPCICWPEIGKVNPKCPMHGDGAVVYEVSDASGVLGTVRVGDGEVVAGDAGLRRIVACILPEADGWSNGYIQVRLVRP